MQPNPLRLIMTLLLHFMGPDEILDWALSWASSKAAQREPESQSYSAAGWAGAGKINILAPRKYTSGKRGFIFWYAWESKETSRDDDWLIWNALVIWIYLINQSIWANLLNLKPVDNDKSVCKSETSMSSCFNFLCNNVIDQSVNETNLKM